MEFEEIYAELGIDKKIVEFSTEIEEGLKERFEKIDRTAEYNTLKILKAYHEEKVSEADFVATTGYGYNDEGREKLEKVYARLFGTEKALVRPSITCGTHALTIALSANLRPGDELLSPVGKPYDTLEGVIGIKNTSDIFDGNKREDKRSMSQNTKPYELSDEEQKAYDKCHNRRLTGALSEYGITYRQVDLLPDGAFDYDGIKKAINEKTKLVTIQRSKGYQTRQTFSVEKIGELIRFIKSIKPEVAVMVDNCYGEFVQKTEPGYVGADLVAGSLIKNPGGGLAPIGGYIAGREDLIDNCAYRLNAPGLGSEVGASLGLNRTFYQGLFMAPTVTAAAIKGAVFAANCYERLGFKVVPDSKAERYDIIQAVELGKPESVIAFCQGIQAASPVDSHVVPEPWPMPGYHSDVIMAAGNFISGASIELSADAPIEPPYAVYFQGGLTFGHAKYGIMMSMQKMFEKGLISFKQ